MLFFPYVWIIARLFITRSMALETITTANPIGTSTMDRITIPPTFDVPTLIVHGDDDQIVPIGNSALLSAKLVKNATLKIYPGGAHSLGDTSKEQLNADLLVFLKA